MAFSPQFLDELRDRIGLAEIVGRRVQLTRKGREHSGLCPFHKEKTPSFTLNEEKGFYHCFGCGAHGSAIDFLMQMDGLSFPEAVERLAQDAGMEIPADSPEERARAERRQTLQDVTEKAARFFEQKLRMPEGRAALEYLKGRGLDDATIARFRLGFSPDGRGLLRGALSREGASDELMVGAGLLIRPDDPGREPYDRFRGRVMFPITDRRGRVIAFGGRILGAGEPKYLNSPETPLFHKGRVLYGLAEAAAPARKAGTVIVTEGYMDVIALHRAGLGHAVAPLGTALTEEQIQLLWKVVAEPVLCFDGDNAGKRAAMRAAERVLPLLTPGHTLRFAELPPGEDPDSLVAARGAEAMTEIIAQAQPLSDVLWLMETGGRVPKTPEQRAKAQKALEDHARRIADATVRGHFLKSFKDRLWAGAQGAYGGRGARGGGRGAAAAAMSLPAGAVRQARIDPHELHERILLATLIGHPGLFDEVGERLGTVAFSAPGLDNLRQEVLKTLAGEAGLDSDAVRRHLRESGCAELLDAVLSPRVYEHAFFAKPETDPETAGEGWDETYALYKNADLRHEIQEERQRLSDDTIDENVTKLVSIAERVNEVSKGIEEHPAAGIPKGAGKH